jgi:23S rRNA pseudouridine2605 synthase
MGLVVNRLIRLSFGPFALGELEPGAVEEIKRRVLADQLGEDVALALGLKEKRQNRGEAAAPKEVRPAKPARPETRAKTGRPGKTVPPRAEKPARSRRERPSR